MRTLIYTSREVAPFDRDGLLALLAASRERNAAADLTGLLIYSGGSFLQLLEGPEDAVAGTYARITADGRHRDLRLLTDDTTPTRRFPDWAMGFEAADDDDLARALPGYTATRFPLADPATVTNAAVAASLLSVYRGGA